MRSNLLPHSFSGIVVRGAGRGKTLGIPTANLKARLQEDLPLGVYAARVTGTLFDGVHIAVANIGMRPTFSESELAIELHIIDFSGDLYGTELDVDLLFFLRDERKFSNAEDLREQIGEDIKLARERLK